jgi:glutamine amidotransferase
MNDQPLIAVLDYGIGNLRSAQKHCNVAAPTLVSRWTMVSSQDARSGASGVGAFRACMTALREADLEDVVEEAVDSGRPFLGICVGMQMLFDGSEEDGLAVGLGVIPGTIRWLGSEPRPQCNGTC